MALSFDTHESIRRLRGKGFDEPQAEGVVEFVRDATAEQVTREHFDGRFAVQDAYVDARFAQQDARIDARFAEQRAEFYRALWVFGGGIVAANAAIVTAVVTITQVLA